MIVLFFYRRLVAGQWVDKFIFPVMGLVGATATAMGLIIALTCRPLYLMWQIRPDPGENCVPQNKIYFYSIFVMNVTTDLCIIAIPIPVISLVRASIWRRIGVYFLFSLGIFIMIAATIRVVLIFHPTGGFGPGAMWSIREDFIAIFVGQAPMVVPLFKRRVWAQFYHKYKFTPKSSQGSDGIELSDGISSNHNNDKKKPKDPYSLTQLGFTHVTNATLGTRNEATLVAKDSSEPPAVAVEEVYILAPIRDFGPDLGAIEFVSRADRHSLEITAMSDLPRDETIKLVSKREEL
ncbi:Kinesin-like protein [Colletotrichum scovillei]|nr:Kinesin-like protein [Colletotrichum scovillei]